MNPLFLLHWLIIYQGPRVPTISLHIHYPLNVTPLLLTSLPLTQTWHANNTKGYWYGLKHEMCHLWLFGFKLSANWVKDSNIWKSFTQKQRHQNLVFMTYCTGVWNLQENLQAKPSLVMYWQCHRNIFGSKSWPMTLTLDECKMLMLLHPLKNIQIEQFVDYKSLSFISTLLQPFQLQCHRYPTL
jgi:hypothetical protein